MKNEDRFNRGVGLILGHLLDTFPIEARFLDLTKIDPEPVDDAVIEVYWHTIQFLEREGFINARQVGDGVPFYANVSLTLRALTLLNAIPDSLQQKTSWGDRIGAAAKAGAKEGLSVVVRQFFDYAGIQLGFLPRQG